MSKNITNGINNTTEFSVDEKLLSMAVEVVLKEEKKEEKEISIAVVGEEEIRELNRIYRGKDSATDVLAFFYGEKDFLGEVVLCPTKIIGGEGRDFTKEICRVTIHGALHLLGYDHKNDEEEELMTEKTEKYLQKLFS